jgi:ribonuclease P protein subunit RPR2
MLPIRTERHLRGAASISPCATDEEQRDMAAPWLSKRRKPAGARHEREPISFDVLDSMVGLLAAALEMRDDETGQHTHRVTDLGLALAEVVSPELAADPQLRYGFLLHDIGKIGVPDAILLKPTPLSDHEMRLMEQHTVLGAQLVKSSPFLSGVAHDVIAFHHERWDGTGYPWGLAGEAIPLAARLFAVVDSFDAMTSQRPYREPVTTEEALVDVERNAGAQFDPLIVERFIPLVRELEEQTGQVPAFELDAV